MNGAVPLLPLWVDNLVTKKPKFIVIMSDKFLSSVSSDEAKYEWSQI